MLLHLIDVLSCLAPIGIGQIRRTNESMFPLHREARTDDANRIEGMRDNAIQSLNNGAGGCSRTVREVAVTLSTGGIEETDLSEIARTAT